MESDLSPGLNSAGIVPITPPVIRSAGSPTAGNALAPVDFIAWFIRGVTVADPRNYRRAFSIFAAVLGGLFLLVVSHGPPTQFLYGHDDLGFLASAWRVRNGLWPHADYHSAMGALNPWIHAAGMWLLGPTAFVLPSCNALVAVAIGLLAWTVAARRLPAALAACFAFTQAVVAMSPHLLRFDWFAATYDGYYNRQCHALLSTLMLLVFLSRRVPEGPRGQRCDERIAGAILGALLFLKISYFMAGVGLCGVNFLAGKQWRGRLPWNLPLAFAAVVLLCLPLIRFDFAAMMGDLHAAAAARTGNPAAVFTIGGFLQWIPDAWLEIVLLAIVQALLQPPWIFRRETTVGSLIAAPSWAEFAGIVGAHAFLVMTNSPGGHNSESPLLACWMFVLLRYFVRAPADWNERFVARCRWRPLPTVCLLVASLWMFTFSRGLACLLWSSSPWPTEYQRLAMKYAPAFDSDSLADLRIFGLGGESPMPVPYATKINDGLRLLRSLGGTHRVEDFDFVNPFPFALGWPPSRGGLWCWHNGYSFSKDAHPTPEEAFGDADVLMLPKHPGHLDSFDSMKAVYSRYIDTNFRVEKESAEWYLLRRR